MPRRSGVPNIRRIIFPFRDLCAVYIRPCHTPTPTKQRITKRATWLLRNAAHDPTGHPRLAANLGPSPPLGEPEPQNPRSDLYGAGAEAVGSTIGAAVGGPPGALLGGVLGRGAHALFKAITGFGDYRVEHNTPCSGDEPPEIVNSANRGSVIIRHREYLGDVNATTAFTLQQYPINPGNNFTFPWLSQVAESFEEYRLRGAIFEFKSLSSDAVLSSATSSALGSVIMATQYDVLDEPFLNKMEMENYEFANSSKPSCTFYHPIECKKSLTPRRGRTLRAQQRSPGQCRCKALRPWHL